MTKNSNSLESSINLSKWNSYFDVGKKTIRISGSNFTGYECVFINEKLVSQKRNWTFKSTHKIKLNDVDYEVAIELLSIFRPKINIKLIKDNIIIDEDFIFTKEADNNNDKTFKIILGLLLGASTSILTYKFLLWFLEGSQ